MSDLNGIQATEATRIVGSDAAGVEQTPVQSTNSGALHTNLRDSDGNAITSTTINSDVGLDTNIINPLTISKGRATVSTLNSTTTPLLANGVFTGTWEEVLDYGSVSAIIDTDKNSATNGVRFELSSDGINVDAVHEYTKDVAVLPEGGVGIFPIKSRYFRVKYTNGNSAQTFFRLQTIYHPFPAGPTNLIGTQIADTSAALITRSVITGKSSAGGGTYENVKVTPSGSLTIAIGDITGVDGQAPMATSFPVVIASDQTDVPIKDVMNVAGVNGAITVGTTAVAARVGASNLANRKNLTIHNNSLVTLYWGYSNLVTTANGTPLYSNQIISLDVGPNITIYLIASIAGNNVRITEAS